MALFNMVQQYYINHYKPLMLIFARSLKWMISESETWAGAEKQKFQCWQCWKARPTYRQKGKEFLQFGAPQLCLLVYKPHEYYSYFCTINHSYWSYLHQLNAILGAPHCRCVILCDHINATMTYNFPADFKYFQVEPCWHAPPSPWETRPKTMALSSAAVEQSKQLSSIECRVSCCGSRGWESLHGAAQRLLLAWYGPGSETRVYHCYPLVN